MKHCVLSTSGIDDTDANPIILFLLLKIPSEKKNKKSEYRYFPESNFAGANILFALVYSNQDDSIKTQKAITYHLAKGIIKKHHHQRKELLWQPN